MMNRRVVKYIVMLAALGIAGAVHAQSSSSATQQSAAPAKVIVLDQGSGAPVGVGMPGGTFAFERIMGDFDSAVVKNAPFSARITRESIQLLADGNRIDRKESGTIARDSVGRTRRETSLPAIGPLAASGAVPHFVFIKDPAAGKSYILDEEKKTAGVMSIISSQGKSFPYKIEKYGLAAEEPAVSTESLGTKTIEGLSVQGTRTTRTIPAGRIGNENPIVITTEKWYSPDLQTVVSLTRTDPRFGTTTYQLTSINRADPPQSLFIVPQDYTIKSGGMMKRRFAKPAPAPDDL
jgi:hypothetical protein